MRVGAEWIYSREHLGDAAGGPGVDQDRLHHGRCRRRCSSLISLILGGLGVRRVRGGGGTGLLRASLLISVVLLAAYLVAVWAMGAKPA